MSRDGRRAVMLALALLFTAPSRGEAQSLNEVYRRVSTSVVVIRARGQEVTAEGTTRFKEIGSGVLITPDGKVATAAHVVHTEARRHCDERCRRVVRRRAAAHRVDVSTRLRFPRRGRGRPARCSVRGADQHITTAGPL